MSTKSFISDFKSFALKGNVVDLAVAVVIGAAFGKIVSAFVADLIMPVVSLVMPSGNWRSHYVILRHAADAKNDILLRWGDLAGDVLDFLVVALVLFIVVQKILRARREPAAPTTRACPYCLETLPLAATRCRACTSQLPAADEPLAISSPARPA
ncbi:MAG TPA: large conductance mechanosensitive channel protein MscL [Polyangiaceae bacterium]|jgi:large conductance mechanosensitive channel